ncbi:hypothetical protein MAPG_10618 [Magnaporthiopsis poae ATCC 64411]|uniref:Lipase-like C-terminal domain-containing protein n=1 Tax=Magnaporthiopsis poae (strain ATCC 64411 / 73-15) TaxID=644358 RepID=A0A0C4ED25_MAGP6|nr:hypothetical protein MAPG_10618 [Magnaporthiopsis poae ATCC 64411]
MGNHSSQPGKPGLQKLRDLVAELGRRHGNGTRRGKGNEPIVLVPGFSSFGEPLFGSFNYWGGFEDLALELQQHTRVPVILPRIGPFSSNWERACELYCQLRNIQSNPPLIPFSPVAGFDIRGSPPTNIAVDYGTYIPTLTPNTHFTKQAVVLGKLPPTWQWGEACPVHMICHSQGGNTVRLLLELLSGRHGLLNSAYFSRGLGDRQDWVRSVVTLGTPYLGTTITGVIFDDILRDVQVDELISRLVVSACLNPTRFVDLQLGHWGFTRNPGESFLGMHNRLRNGIHNWWRSDYNAVKDNGVPGIARLNNQFSPGASIRTYYFTMSFDATTPLPRQYLTGIDLESVPVHPLLRLAYPGPYGVTARIVSSLFSLGRDALSFIPGNPSDLSYARWAVGVINNHVRTLGYQLRIPSPGERIPRPDMLPALSIFSAGMSGVDTFGPQNDGVVDTASMRGPENAIIRDSDQFDRDSIGNNRGVYWDLGVTEGIDHADQVGVFTDAVMYGQVREMYQLLGDLVSFL